MNRPRLVLALALLLPAYLAAPGHAVPPPMVGAGMTCGLDAGNSNAIGDDRYTGTISAGPFGGVGTRDVFPYIDYTCTVQFGGGGRHSSPACYTRSGTTSGPVLAPVNMAPIVIYVFEADGIDGPCHEVFLCTKVRLHNGYGGGSTSYYDASARQFTGDPGAPCAYAVSTERSAYHVSPELTYFIF